MKHTLVFPFPIFTFALLMTVTYSVAIIYYKFSAYCQIIVCKDILEFVFLNSWNHHKKCPGLLVGKKKKEPLPGRCGTSARSAVKQLFRALFF